MGQSGPSERKPVGPWASDRVPEPEPVCYTPPEPEPKPEPDSAARFQVPPSPPLASRVLLSLPLLSRPKPYGHGFGPTSLEGPGIYMTVYSSN